MRLRPSKIWSSLLSPLIVAIDSMRISSSIEEILKYKNWTKVKSEEMKPFEKKSTREIIEKQEGNKPVGCRWIYIVKHKSDGTFDCYEETFAIVPKMNIVQILLFLSVYSEWELQQFDVKNVFLHENLDEEVYMDIPLGFGTSNEANKCVD